MRNLYNELFNVHITDKKWLENGFMINRNGYNEYFSEFEPNCLDKAVFGQYKAVSCCLAKNPNNKPCLLYRCIK